MLNTYEGSHADDEIVPITHRVEFFDDTNGNLADHVTDIRFDFLEVENGWSGYQEIDVMGTETCFPYDIVPPCSGGFSFDKFQEISEHFYTVPSAAGQDGDLNFDNFVDEKDFRLWKEFYLVDGVAAVQSIPEPTTSSLAILAALLCLRRSSLIANRNRQ